ncbi:putative transcriptional regulatory protein [Fusarium oxysporum f. sp. rapae]|uniref:Putative transcriptional regulatory protein n=1 Tax=Fusarium oxysporum f. sp. rapae TaxID=485398 RepID=A0A8J5P7P0_FUSOX|nr:putative transcriptional regulatory protein [Fusarium oxysporum f. sp. rapae]
MSTSSRSPRISGVRKTQNKTSLAHVEDLENRLAQYEGRNHDMGDWVPDAVDVPSPFSTGHDAQQPQDTPPVAPSPIPRSTTRPATSIPLTGPSIETDSSLSSSATFGSRVQNMLSNARHTRDIPRPAAHVSNNHNSSPRQANNTYHDSLPFLPSESEAYRLLDVVTMYIGQSQCHFDAREVSDNIELYFTDPEGQLPPTPWFFRMSIIFAVGKLLSDEDSASNGDADLGSGLFEFVHAHLPTPSEQYAQGRVAVETLTLLGVYLQAMNRKEEAYIYTSIALRLAVTHGYHRPLEGTRILRSEKAHIGRLWWTIYMQERRLAAATGHPYGIDDAFIVLEYPIDQPGFSSTQPIRINARIARVTSRILIDLYNPKRQNQDSFVQDVKDIIRCLHDISSEIPENLAKVAHGPNANVSVRTTASLQLMLYQATLLTIRPVMLHVAHLILAGASSGLEKLGNSSLAQLCRACTEAARRIVRTTITLRRMKLLAIFGFFDCDAIFSATFVLILTAVFDSACEDKDKINPSPGLGEAMESLQYLADNHNTTAVERLQEIHEILHHLPENLRTNKGTAVPSRDGSQPVYDSVRQAADDSQSHDSAEPVNNTGETDDTTQPVVDLGLSRPVNYMNSVEQESLGSRLDAEQHLSNLNVMSEAWVPSVVNTGTVPSDDLIPTDIQLDEYYGYFQSLLDNSDWYLTGQDVGDMAEFGRHVVNFSRSE